MIFRYRLLVVLSLAGLLLNVLLLYWKLTGSGVAGCGEGACDEVLTSRWSEVLRVPLPVFGVAIYVLLYAALLWRRNGWIGFCCAAIAGAALWLVFVQGVFLRDFCGWCMATHGVGVLAAVLGFEIAEKGRGVQAGIAGALGLALLQLYGPLPATHLLVEEAAVPVAGRRIAFDGGRKIFDISALPLIGDPAAEHVLVEYFDYRCPACRTMRGHLAELVARHPAKVAVVVLPVPLEHGCNPMLDPSATAHPGSCELARIALAVWRTRPQAFAATHDRFLSDPEITPAAALESARKETAPADLDAALRDPWIDSILLANAADWAALSRQTRNLPKLLVRDRRVLHGLPSGGEDFIRVMEKELGL